MICTRALSLLLLSVATTAQKPLQGVFTTSNEDTNQVGVFKQLEDGALEWMTSYDTGGVGTPNNLFSGFPQGWTGANNLHMHVWNEKQWLLVINPGGEKREVTVSIFEVAADLTLTLTDNIAAVSGCWGNSVAGFEDRVCTLGSAETVKIECFRISADGKLASDFSRDLELNMDAEIVHRGHSGGASIQFSPDGTRLAVVHKGGVDELFPFSRTPSPNNPNATDQGGLLIYPVTAAGYGTPLEVELDPYLRIYDFVWHPTSMRLFTVGIPNGVRFSEGFADGNIIAFDFVDSNITQTGPYFYGARAGRWLEYSNGMLYSSNFVTANDVSTFEVSPIGIVDVDSRVDYFYGNATEAISPLDIHIGGANAGGDRFLFVELTGSAEIATMLIANDRSLQEVARVSIADADGSRWISNAGVVSTALSQTELNALYSFVTEAPAMTSVAGTAPPAKTPDAAGFSQALQGVFVTSNEDANKVGVYKLLQDGKLEWMESYDTGGVGTPFNLLTNSNSGWSGANCISYHIWNGRQWLLVANPGGEELDASLSIFEVAADLTLTLTDNAPIAQGSWGNSATGFADRACALGSARSVVMDCFRITEEGKLLPQFSRDFNLNIPVDVSHRGHAGGASIQFSPDGTKLAIVHKGGVDRIFPFSRTLNLNRPQVTDQAALIVYPVTSAGYGQPLEIEMDPYRRVYDFVWHTNSQRIFTVGIPTGVIFSNGFNDGNIITFDLTDSAITEVGTYYYGDRAGCWIEYLEGKLYTSNFVVDHDISTFAVDDNGVVDVARVDFRFGDDTGPLDVHIGGATASGDRYLFVELTAGAEVATMKIETDGSINLVARTPIADPSSGTTWISNAGIVSTTLSQTALDTMYAMAPPPTAPPPPIPTSSSSLPCLVVAVALSSYVFFGSL